MKSLGLLPAEYPIFDLKNCYRVKADYWVNEEVLRRYSGRIIFIPYLPFQHFLLPFLVVILKSSCYQRQ
jgi:hypothetical protein